MNRERKLKYGTIVAIMSMVLVVFLSLLSAGFLFLREVFKSLFEVQLSESQGVLDIIFYGGAIISAAFAIIMLVAGLRAQYSKGWNIFIGIISGIVLLSYLGYRDIIGIIVFGAFLTLTILNVRDANRQITTIDTSNKAQDLEAKLKALDNLFDKGLISQEEYQTSRQTAISKVE